MITPEDYKIVSDNISLGQDQEETIVDNSDEIITELESLLAYMESVSSSGKAFFYISSVGELLSSVENTKNEVQDSKIDTTRLVSTLVLALQEHVEDHYGDINDFLSSNSIKVKQTFADLSLDQGFTIDSGNIE